MGQILASLKHDLREARRYLRAAVQGRPADPIVPWDGKGSPLPSMRHETFEEHAEEVIGLFDRLVAIHAPTPAPASLAGLISYLRGRNSPRMESGAVENFDGREWTVVGRLGEAPPVLIQGAPSAPAPMMPLVLTAGCPRCGEPLDPSREVMCTPCVREL